jgi:hypothetical protein
MTERILSAQLHAEEGAEAWRVLAEGAYAFFATGKSTFDPAA